MREPLADALSHLRADFALKAGHEFRHFFCPILHRDEDVPLCRGHVVNQAFAGVDRTWTVQREDVDSFFGSRFESDFVLLQERGRHHIADVLGDPTLARKLRPRVTLDGDQVPFYRPNAVIPTEHTELMVEHPSGSPVRLALKMSPSDVLAAESGGWRMGFECDLRLPALVSLLKAAHLTMFWMIGYEWALSAGGRFVGHDVLGRFYDDHKSLTREEALAGAERHFLQFKNMVRPIVGTLGSLRGTVTDRHLYLCTGSDGPWGFVVIVRTGSDFHGVLLPVFEHAEAAARYVRFLEEPAPRFHAKLLKFAGDHWDISTREDTMHWPQANWT